MSRKLCRGPAHPQPTWLPLDDFGYFRSGARAGEAFAFCMLCRRWARLKVKDGPHGFVPAAPLAILAKELIDRCGSGGAAERRSGVSDSTLLKLAKRKRVNVTRLTAQQLLVGLAEQRKIDRRNGASIRFLEARKAQARIEERLEREGCG